MNTSQKGRARRAPLALDQEVMTARGAGIIVGFRSEPREFGMRPRPLVIVELETGRRIAAYPELGQVWPR